MYRSIINFLSFSIKSLLSDSVSWTTYSKHYALIRLYFDYYNQLDDKLFVPNWSCKIRETNLVDTCHFGSRSCDSHSTQPGWSIFYMWYWLLCHVSIFFIVLQCFKTLIQNHYHILKLKNISKNIQKLWNDHTNITKIVNEVTFTMSAFIQCFKSKSSPSASLVLSLVGATPVPSW